MLPTEPEGCLDLVQRHVPALAERRRCYLKTAQSTACRRRWFRLLMEPVEAVAPRAATIEPWLFDLGAAVKRVVGRSIAFGLEKAPVAEAGRGRHNLPS